MPQYANFVYCAGPLFIEKQREEMNELAIALEGEGFGTFLPQTWLRTFEIGRKSSTKGLR